MSNANRPKPPKDITGEARAEWKRVCAELDAAGRLEKIDRAILTLYCKTWQIHQSAMEHVNKYGAIVKLANGVTCGSPFYKVSRETAVQLRGLLADMCMTYATRPKGTAAPTDDLDF